MIHRLKRAYYLLLTLALAATILTRLVWPQWFIPAATDRWSTARLPVPLSDPLATAVGGKAILVEPASGGANVLDTATGRWAKFPLPPAAGDAYAAAVAVGTSALFATGHGRLSIYDDLTGNWSTSHLPDGADGTQATASLGRKALFVGAFSVSVFDLATGQWSTAPLSQARTNSAAVTVGDRVIVAGGGTSTSVQVDNVDLYTDTAPAASLDGFITAGDGGHSVSVTVRNSGDAAVAGPFTVAVYGSRGGHKSVLLGRATARRALRSGTTKELTVDLSIPAGSALSDYRLVAQAAGDQLNPTAFAARDDVTAPEVANLSARALRESTAAYTFALTYHDNDAIDTDTVDGGDIVVTGPGGFAKRAGLVSLTRGRHGSTRIATYSVRGDGLRWDASDNGTYTVHLQDGELRDAAGNAAVGRRLGTFAIAIPPTAQTPPPTNIAFKTSKRARPFLDD